MIRGRLKVTVRQGTMDGGGTCTTKRARCWFLPLFRNQFGRKRGMSTTTRRTRPPRSISAHSPSSTSCSACRSSSRQARGRYTCRSVRTKPTVPRLWQRSPACSRSSTSRPYVDSRPWSRCRCPKSGGRHFRGRRTFTRRWPLALQTFLPRPLPMPRLKLTRAAEGAAAVAAAPPSSV